jgi:hypothetical protein
MNSTITPAQAAAPVAAPKPATTVPTNMNPPAGNPNKVRPARAGKKQPQPNPTNITKM